MKLLGKTRDGAIDKLLRAYVSRPTAPRQECPDFDPDLTNAYIERGLTASSRVRFEEHLSECAVCRTGVVTLTRLAQGEAPAPLAPARGEARSERPSIAAQLFRTLSQPQWAMAAAAAIVLAISLPLILSRTSSPLAERTSLAVSEEQATDKNESARQTAAASKVGSLKQERSNPSLDDLKPSEKREPETVAKNEIAAGDTTAATARSRASGTEQFQKTEAKAEPQPSDDAAAKSKSDGQVAQAPAPAGAQASSELAKKEPDSSRQQQSEKDQARANESKVARADDERAEQEKARKAEEVTAVPASPPSPQPGRASKGLRRPGAKLALRDSAGEAVRPAEKRIFNKKFLYKDDAWTDKDFDPDKDLPVVTIIRDSNVYNEVLSKRTGLKPFLTAFSETERAIIVYKGTVYKLIPQSAK